jgi:hypothetical protein
LTRGKGLHSYRGGLDPHLIDNDVGALYLGATKSGKPSPKIVLCPRKCQGVEFRFEKY